MNKYLLGGIIVLLLACIGLGIFGYCEHGSKVKAQQQVISLTESNNSLQLFLQEKNKAYEKVNKKYKELLKTKPHDVCGDSVVNPDIINWLKVEVKSDTIGENK